MYWDHATPAHAGAAGMTQVEELKESDDTVTHLVDQGLLFPEEGRLDALRRLISRALGHPAEDIEIDEPDEDDGLP